LGEKHPLPKCIEKVGGDNVSENFLYIFGRGLLIKKLKIFLFPPTLDI